MKISLMQFLAYIDPGSGSLLLQFLIAAFVGTLAFFRRSILALFSRSKSKPEEAERPAGDMKP